MKKFKTLNKATLQQGFDFLSEKEPAFKRILEEKNYDINPFSKKSGFEGLIGLIIEQQLSVASAKAIFKRLKKLVVPFEPEAFLKVDIQSFKEAGLSKQKIDYCSGIAEKIKNKELDLNSLSQKEDSEVVEELIKIRGIGDILVFKQSGIKSFKLADPIHNNDLFLLAEKEMRRIEKSNENISKFKPLIKLYDRADIINDIA